MSLVSFVSVAPRSGADDRNAISVPSGLNTGSTDQPLPASGPAAVTLTSVLRQRGTSHPLSSVTVSSTPTPATTRFPDPNLTSPPSGRLSPHRRNRHPVPHRYRFAHPRGGPAPNRMG